MLKRFLAALLSFMLVFGACCPALAEYPAVNAVITIDGVRAAFFTEEGTYLPPVEVDGLVYVPVLSLSESLGLDVTADPEKLLVTIDGIRTAFFSDDGAFLQPVLIDGLVYVPLESFIISAGLFVTVEDNKIAITRKQPEPTAMPMMPYVMVTAEPVPAYGLVPLDENNFWDYFGYSVSSSVPSSFNSPIKIYYYVNFGPLTPYEPINVTFSVKVGDRNFGKAVMSGSGEVKLSDVESHYGDTTELMRVQTNAIMWELNTPVISNVSGNLRMSGMEAQMINGQDYDQAMEYMENELYDLAEPIFVRLSRVDFKDSKEQVRVLRQKQQEKTDRENAQREASYQDALKKQGEGLYDEAIAIFTELGDYSDAATQVLKCHYLQAEFQLGLKNYAAADAAFKAAGEYSNAAGRIGEGYYTHAEALLNQKKYDEASTAFKSAGAYKDAADRAKEAIYLKAEALLAEKKYDDASAAFKSAGTCKDASSRVNEPYYVKAQDLLAAGDYAGAAEAFGKAGSYSDAAELVTMPYYAQGEALLAEGKPDEAIEAFRRAGDYSDAASRITQIHISLAEEAIAQGKWDEASAAFDRAGLTDRLGDPYIIQGDQLLAAGEKQSAIAAYATAQEKGSQSAEEKIRQVHALLGSEAEAALNWSAALEEYQVAGMEDQALNAKYRLAEERLSAGDYIQAQTLFAELKDYADARSRGLEVHFRKGEKAQAEGDYVLAQTEYRLAGNHTGAAGKLLETIRLQADKLTSEEKYDEAYLLYLSIMDDSIREMIKNNAGLKSAAADWKSGVQTGKLISFGSYPTNTPGKHESLQWLVLSRENNKALLWCVSNLGKQPFQNNSTYVTWGHSDLRYWLNNSFLHAAFSPALQQAIVLTDVKNKQPKGSTASPGNHTKDYLFCLDNSEHEKYLVKNTRNAKLVEEMILSDFWLRSMYTQLMPFTADPQGERLYIRCSNKYAVQPAMWIDLNSPLFK